MLDKYFEKDDMLIG